MQDIHFKITFWLFLVTDIEVAKTIATFLIHFSLAQNIDLNRDLSYCSCSK